jgi:hypothetical protein
MKIEGSGSASGSESGAISQRHGSTTPDPDPHQNVMDPNTGPVRSQSGSAYIEEVTSHNSPDCGSSWQNLS